MGNQLWTQFQSGNRERSISPTSEQAYSLLWKKPGKKQIHSNAE